MANSPGTVYLVGAGPGDPHLLTRRGEALLRCADVVVYDRLVDPELLRLCRADAELLFVGKQGYGASVPQDQTNQLLVERARRGQLVIRLKGGDPFVFGRGGEEALELRSAGVPFEIVPGVSSAVAAPAYAGIPVTYRGLASSVAIVTGSEDPTKDASMVDWGRLAQGADTLVVLMGVEHLAAIAGRLIAGGRPSDQPAALIRWGTTPRQERLLGTLGTIADLALQRQVRPPAILVVGQVAALADRLDWFGQGPLFGRRVLVTRARAQASTLSQQLRELGAEPLEFPTIRIEPLADPSPLDQALARLAEFDWVVLTSVNGVEACFERLAAGGQDARAFAGVKIAAIGPATERALAGRGLRADFLPRAFTSEAIVRELAPAVRRGARLLLPRADIAPAALADGLAAAGAEVTSVPAYRTLPDMTSRAEIVRRLEADEIDVVTFSSASTVRNLVDGLDGRLELLARPLIACIGPVTAATAVELGLAVDLVAPVHTIDGLVNALQERLADHPTALEVPR